MSQEQMAEVKLACLKMATERCVNNPGEILKVAKEYYEWVLSIN
jgi:hypothetical protein